MTLEILSSHSVWPGWAIYRTLGNFSKPVVTISLLKSPTFLAIFCVSKSLIFLVNSFLGNFYRHLAIFYWSHWSHSPTLFTDTGIPIINARILPKKQLYVGRIPSINLSKQICQTRIAHKSDCTQEHHLFISTKHPHLTYPLYETTHHIMMFHTYK